MKFDSEAHKQAHDDMGTNSAFKYFFFLVWLVAFLVVLNIFVVPVLRQEWKRICTDSTLRQYYEVTVNGYSLTCRDEWVTTSTR